MGYLRDRLLQAVVTVYTVVTLGFLLMKLMPGGPIDFLKNDMRENPAKYGLPPRPTSQQINRAIETLVDIPPDRPLHMEYLHYIYSVFVELDLGTSIIVAANVPVTELILGRAPWTILLSVLGLVYALIVSILLGSAMAYYEGSKFDVGMTVSMILDSAVPYYVAALGLLFVFGFQLQWFPTGGRANPDAVAGANWPYVSSVFYHAALPALSTILTGFGANALGLRANAIRLLGDNYIHVADLRGLSRYRIASQYLARNAILPMYTGIVIGLGGLIGGSVILEYIFQYPGMGMLMYDAAIMRDFPLLMGAFFITTIVFVIGTLIADFTYGLVDPRADVKEAR